MANETTRALINQLDALLDDERNALLHGDLASIGPLLNRKEELIDALNTLEPGAQADMAQMHGKVMRNQVLLDGALQGIRAVTGRLAAFRKIRRSLEIYDQTGQRTVIADTIEHKLEKRA